jgi:hypothetical protein
MSRGISGENGTPMAGDKESVAAVSTMADPVGLGRVPGALHEGFKVFLCQMPLLPHVVPGISKSRI